jgi:hypothetical protein
MPATVFEDNGAICGLLSIPQDAIEVDPHGRQFTKPSTSAAFMAGPVSNINGENTSRRR